MTKRVKLALAMGLVVAVAAVGLVLYVRLSIAHLGFLTPADVKVLLAAANATKDASERPVSLTDKAYTVISAFLRVQLAGKNSWDDIRVGDPGSVIAPVTMELKGPITAHEKEWMKRELKGLRDDTIASFQRCAANSVALDHLLSLPVEYQVATPEEANSIETLYANHPYPNTWGLLRFSCVGWDTSETQALFFFERTMCRCGASKFVLMEKNAAGDWEIKGEMVRWIS